MKKYLYKLMSVALMGLLVVCTSSCEDYLTVPTESQYDSTNLFQTVTQAEMTMYGAYVIMAHPMYGRKVVTMTTADTDVLRQQGGWDTVGRKNFARYSSTPASVDTELNSLWNKWYSCIERSNIVIDRVPQMEMYENGTDEQKAALQRVYGEALCLRALCYLDLMVRWGDVPATFTPSASGENFYVDRTSRDEIYDHLVDDLLLAVDLLPWRKDVAAQARFTKGAAKGLLARVCLHAAGYSLRWNLADGSNLGMRTRDDQNRIKELYQIAKQQCSDVINDPSANHRLNPVYMDIWKTLGSCKFDTDYGESMFEIGMCNPELVSAYNGQIGSKIGMKIASGSKYGKCSSEVLLTPSYVLSFAPHDTRYNTIVGDMEINKTDQGIITNKVWEYSPAKWRLYWNPTYVTDYTNTNWIYLRYADVLLMYAEAENWLNGPTASAIDALKQVRKRAYKGNESEIEAENYSGMSKDEFLDVIIQERAWELGAEALRKYDLIRWNKLAEAIAKTKAANKEISSNTTKYPKYIYYKTCADPTKNHCEFVLSNKNKDTDLTGQGYVQTNYTNGMSSNADIMSTYAQDFQENKTELYPIPQSICDDNPKLSQHPSYRAAN